MVVPIADQTLEQVRTTQERRVEHAGGAHHEMIAAAGAGMFAVNHELLGGEAGELRLLVQEGGVGDQLVPA